MVKSRLRYTHEIPENGDLKRFVYFCSECCCILKTSRKLGPVSDAIESLANRCPGCDARLDSSIVCRSSNIAEEWPQIEPTRSPPKVDAARKVLFQPASALRGFCFGFPPLDRVIHRLDAGWLAVFTGRNANAAAELLCFRAQLPRENGGLDSSVVFIDGGNYSDLYLFASYARQHGVDPKKAMRRIVTSRAFTMHQLANLVTRDLPRVVDDYGSKLVIISDVLGTFNEPELDQEEARMVLDAVRRGMRRIRKDRKVLLLATLTTKTPYDRAVTDSADLLLDFGASRSRATAELVKHPFKRPASAAFKLQELLQPVRQKIDAIQNGENGTIIQSSGRA